MQHLEAVGRWWTSQSPLALAEHALAAAALLHIVRRVFRTDVPLWKAVAVVPGVKGLVNHLIEKEVNAAITDLFPAPEDTSKIVSFHALPPHGVSKDVLLATMQAVQSQDVSGENGCAWAYVYDTDDAHHNEFLCRILALFVHANALNPFAFPSLRKFETEVVAMTLHMLHGPPSTAVGTMTSGGTESILCAVYAYRERARELWPHITIPEMVLPSTAHVAFSKAAHYFGVKPVFVPVAEDYRVDLLKYAEAITSNTILLVASAPQYPHGVIDPISAVGDLAQARGVPFHVDACIGGFLLPWVKKLGYDVPPWDFSVAGVTSISADVHKYGFGTKGASTLCFRDASYRRYQFFCSTKWPGGLFVSPSLLGTRSGGSIAAAWGAMCALGEDGYLEYARTLMQTAHKLQNGVRDIEGLVILGHPHMTILAFGSNDPAVNVLAVADVMEKKTKKWKMERQQLPDCIHLTVLPTHVHAIDEFLQDLRSAVAEVRASPELATRGTAAMYGMVGRLPDNAIVEDFLVTLIDRVYR